ncbi:M14 family metallopeptidase [Alteribacter natronophilus]|uniref:M14 family metallopeptidase n=1 Tax=Alteribacter natronophilus TaxID=2583810 RepID=UPI001487097F|nr:M14 family metallopeptidase [Alteribacter natronophilus]
MPGNYYFSNTYEESRAGFREKLSEVKRYWPDAGLETYYIGSREDDNTTDIIAADAIEETKDLIIITTGEHGVEGFTGSAVLQLFIEEYLPEINHKTTGIRLVHAVNPWGMRNFRRVTESNIDLNRNYIKNWGEVTGSVDQTYAREKELFVPAEPLENVRSCKEELHSRLNEAFTTEELADFKDTPSGQHEYRTGVFYGGKDWDEPAQELKSRYLNWVREYDHPLHMDIHSGGGPKDELTLIFTEAESRSEDRLQEDLSYSHVMKSASEDIYGDSNLYMQERVQEDFPGKKTVVCLFEFGTIGESVNDLIFCTRTMINENRLYFQGARKKEVREEVNMDFARLFYPSREEWRKQVIDKGREGLEAVLRSENIQVESG